MRDPAAPRLPAMAGARRGLRAAQALPLEHFIRRGQVLGQYRAFMRALQRLGRNSADADALRAQVRDAFRANAGETDGRVIDAHLAEGRTHLTQLEKMASIAAPADGDSWVGARGLSDQDTLGRVGTGWPWAR